MTRFGLEEGQTPSGKSRRSAAIISLVLLLVILLLALLGNTEIILVILLYLCILLEGISTSAFILYSRSDDGEDLFPESQSQPEIKGNDVVEAMHVYVK